MLDNYFKTPLTEWLRGSSVGAYIDGFAEKLRDEGYSPPSSRTHLYSAAHLGSFLQFQGRRVEFLDEKTLAEFGQHVTHCQCPGPGGGKHAPRGARLFFEYLRSLRVLGVDADNETRGRWPPVVESFRRWLKQHCGAAESTLRLYSHGVDQLVRTLGEDPNHYDAQALRAFVLERARGSGMGATQALIKALRSFLRYLAAEGKCSAALQQAIPSVAGWRLATLPRYLSSAELEGTIDTCDPHTLKGARNRAVLLLLARLGLRAGDVAALGLSDLDWRDATLVVSGKSRWEARLPLPQEVGDAVLQYLELRPELDTEQLFVRTRAPLRRLSATGVSSIARRAMRRAGVSAPSMGAHILRHTAATQMLRQGVPLEEIKNVLRHRSVDMTATYAKVDLDLLRMVAQPWPEVLRCS